tara:strand:+ start:216 stop:371 length:156 start_codon:yes stop_codon:yes gene_type:complete
MKITAWNLVAYDEDGNEVVMDTHDNKTHIPNHVANVIDDFLTEEFEESTDE